MKCPTSGKGVKIASDNRINPRESRIETFEFEVPSGAGKLDTRATLTYNVEAEIITRSLETMSVEIAKSDMTTTLEGYKPSAETTPRAPALGWAGAIISLLAAVMYLRVRRNREI